MNTVIKASGVVKTYGGNNARVLDGVNVEIESGEFVAVMGPSGSGKSTLLFALSGMDGVSEGSISFDGAELSALKEDELADIRRGKMGFVFQQPAILKNLNILDNIILPAMQGKKKNPAEFVKKAKSLMKRTGIAELESRGITEVSGGQLQRAGICRALMNSPRILFADEPTGALNSKSAEEIMALLTEINEEGTAILLVTHDAKVAARAGRVLYTKDGKITAETKFGTRAGNNAGEIAVRTGEIIKRMTEVEA